MYVRIWINNCHGKNLDQCTMIQFCVKFRYNATRTLKNIWWVSCVLCNNISMVHTISKWQGVCQRLGEKRKADSNKTTQKHHYETGFEKGLSSQPYDDSGEYGDIGNNCSTHFLGWFEEKKKKLCSHTVPQALTT